MAKNCSAAEPHGTQRAAICTSLDHVAHSLKTLLVLNHALHWLLRLFLASLSSGCASIRNKRGQRLVSSQKTPSWQVQSKKEREKNCKVKFVSTDLCRFDRQFFTLQTLFYATFYASINPNSQIFWEAESLRTRQKEKNKQDANKSIVCSKLPYPISQRFIRFSLMVTALLFCSRLPEKNSSFLGKSRICVCDEGVV